MTGAVAERMGGHGSVTVAHTGARADASDLVDKFNLPAAARQMIRRLPINKLLDRLSSEPAKHCLIACLACRNGLFRYCPLHAVDLLQRSSRRHWRARARCSSELCSAGAEPASPPASFPLGSASAHAAEPSTIPTPAQHAPSAAHAESLPRPPQSQHTFRVKTPSQVSKLQPNPVMGQLHQQLLC